MRTDEKAPCGHDVSLHETTDGRMAPILLGPHTSGCAVWCNTCQWQPITAERYEELSATFRTGPGGT